MFRRSVRLASALLVSVQLGGVGGAKQAPADSALIVIDMQYDFINGSLPVTGGASIIPTINELAALPGWKFVAYTGDFHPKDHISFAANHPGGQAFANIFINYTEAGLVCGEEYVEQYGVAAQASCSTAEIETSFEQTLWPVHCVQNTVGAKIHHDIVMPAGAGFVRKGYTSVIDSYGAFYTVAGTSEGDLKGRLDSHGVKNVYVVGLALDYCVKFSALQAAGFGYDTTVLLDATKFIAQATYDAAIVEFEEAGVKTAQSDSVAVECDGECGSTEVSRSRKLAGWAGYIITASLAVGLFFCDTLTVG